MEEKLIQYINGKLVPDKEIREVLDWIEASEANRETYNELKKLWILTGLINIEAQTSRKFFTHRNTSRVRKMQLFPAILKYAAVFLLAFLLGALTLYYVGQKQNGPFAGMYNEIQVPNGEKSTVTLYDGTKVWLNSGTTFRYPVSFTGKQRNVFIDGEAYFDVAKNMKQPFVVHAGEINVEVLGTRFNVYSYSDDDLFYTTLEEGAVNISTTGSGKKFRLSPGEQFGFSKQTKTTKLYKVDTGLYTSWKENILRFDNAPLSEILKKMERWYDVRIVVADGLDTGERYTTTIKTESLREMLKVLSLTTNMNYEINEDMVRISKP
ncbi:MAG: DUF4974 domain-containing protein [Prolixibacteraceae bacterium]|jgi:ferric-dicitrate binding protein FerR (iron transport regulator)|nr:DUF4974 domain-containing protein [Prolixibacteraceae bacterium]